MVMRSFLNIGIAGLMLFVAACGGDDGGDRAAVSDTSGGAGGGTENESPGEPFRVAAVLPSTAEDFGISQGVIEGLREMQEEAGAENFELDLSENMFVVDDAAAAIRSYASNGFDMVIAASSAFGSAIEEIAPEFPDTSFVWGTNPETFGLDNVYAFAVRSEQGAYVGGLMAGMMADTAAFVGPIDVGSIATSVDGFAAGLEESNPDARYIETFTGSFSDASLATAAADTAVSEGAIVLAGQTEMGVGVATVAEGNEGVMFFGNDADFSPVAPESTYASQVFLYRVAFDQVVDQIEQGQLGGDIIWLEFENGGIEIVFNEQFDLPEDVRAAADEAIQGLRDGTIDPLG